MEIFGIVLSVPVAFVASMAYCAFLTYIVRGTDRPRRFLYRSSLAVLVLVVVEVLLLVTLGAVRSRAIVGPLFSVVHVALFVLGTPALANALVLRRSGMRWYLAGVACTVFAFGLVLLQYGVSEALYGIDGINGPYSGGASPSAPV